MHTYIHACIHTYIQTDIHTCICMCVYMCIYTYIYIYIYMYVCIHNDNNYRNGWCSFGPLSACWVGLRAKVCAGYIHVVLILSHHAR